MNAITRGMLTAALSNDSELTEFERACFRHLVDRRFLPLGKDTARSQSYDVRELTGGMGFG